MIQKNPKMSKPAIDSKDPNFQMSQEEVKAFENAMKKPEFVDLLSEYMTEISDPKNRAVNFVIKSL